MGMKTAKEKPERGSCLPDFAYTTIEGVARRLSDFKGRRNLVLILTGDPENALLDAIARAYPEFLAHEACVITILKCERDLAARARDAHGWPFEVAADPSGIVHRELGAADASTAVFVTDRWTEVFFASSAAEGSAGPEAQELLDWLTFVEHQCPECFPPEWRT